MTEAQRQSIARTRRRSLVNDDLGRHLRTLDVEIHGYQPSGSMSVGLPIAEHRSKASRP